MSELGAFDRHVRQHVYAVFRDSAGPPSTADLAAALASDASAIERSLRRLQQAHALVLAPGTAHVWMAHPFSAVPTDYPVDARGRRYFANCAWDYFALPALLGASGSQSARCAQTGDRLAATFDDGAFVDGAGVVHFAVQPRRFWENVAFT